MWKCCSQPHHCITDLGIKCFTGSLVPCLMVYNSFIKVSSSDMTPKLLLSQVINSHRFMWGPWVTMSSATSPLMDWYAWPTLWQLQHGYHRHLIHHLYAKCYVNKVFKYGYCPGHMYIGMVCWFSTKLSFFHVLTLIPIVFILYVT